MPVTQRDQDIMELESQLKIRRLFDEWKQSFLGDRLKQEQAPDEPAPQEIENDDSVLSGR